MIVRSLALVMTVVCGPGLVRSEEVVCLKSGFCMHADSHVQNGGNLSVQLGAGSLELATADVASIEALEGRPSVKKDQPPASTRENPQTLLARAAATEGVDADFVRSVAQVESNFRQEAKSRKGAIGLMQIMPATARELSIDAFEAGDNARGGAKYLRSLLVRYHGNSALALAAYNAGPGAVERFGGVPPFVETRQYVRRVTREYDRQKATGVKAAKRTLATPSKPSAKD